MREGQSLVECPTTKRICDVAQHGENAYNKTDAPHMMCITKMVKAFDTKFNRLGSPVEKGLLQGIVMNRQEITDDFDKEFTEALVGNAFVGPLVAILIMLIKIHEARAAAAHAIDAATAPVLPSAASATAASAAQAATANDAAIDALAAARGSSPDRDAGDDCAADTLDIMASFGDLLEL